MSRFQISLNVADVDAAVTFYSSLLGVAPAKHRPGYANFVVADPPLKLVVIEGEGRPGTINHVGVEHHDADAVGRETARLAELGLPVIVDDPHTCCFATQVKAWTRDPDGTPWEIYTVVEDTDHFGANPHRTPAVDELLPPVHLDELRAALADPDIVVVDAQGEGGFERAHLAGAVDVSLDDAVEQIAALVPDRDRRIIVYCSDESCLGSEFVGTLLVQAGYTDVGRFPGGIAEWAQAGLPLAAGDAADQIAG